MPETDKQFVERFVAAEVLECDPAKRDDWFRLMAIAIRGAETQELQKAAHDIIDFHNGPWESKRPDIFQRLVQRLANALSPIPLSALGEPK